MYVSLLFFCLPVIISPSFIPSKTCGDSNRLHWSFKQGSRSVGHLWSAQQAIVETLLAWLPLKSCKKLSCLIKGGKRQGNQNHVLLCWSCTDDDVYGINSNMSNVVIIISYNVELHNVQYITNFQLSPEGTCTNVVSDIWFSLNDDVLIAHLRIIFHHHCRNK